MAHIYSWTCKQCGYAKGIDQPYQDVFSHSSRNYCRVCEAKRTGAIRIHQIADLPAKPRQAPRRQTAEPSSRTGARRA